MRGSETYARASEATIRASGPSPASRLTLAGARESASLRFASLRFVMENSRETRDPEVDLIEQGLRFLTTDR